MCLEVLNLHNTAISRLQGLTNALRVSFLKVFELKFNAGNLENGYE
jgi:hypothetical protein